MRLYSFVNFYLSSIQQGIQTGHLSDNMSVKYLINVTWELPRKNVYVDWITNHKTYITLNGGANLDIQHAYDVLEDIGEALELPFGYFREDELSLGNLMTCCGIVVPEHLYNTMNYRSFIFKFPTEKFNKAHNEDAFYYVNEEGSFRAYQSDTPEWRLIDLLKSCGLAR